MYTSALQQDEFLRIKYTSEVSAYSKDMLVFVDETGADQRNTIRKYGYSVRGKPIRNHKLLVRGERVSAIACISTSGLLDVKVVQGTSDGDTFYDFVAKCLLQNLLPYNGINKHSVVIMDNCSIHHSAEIATMINQVGALLLYLPPYSPDLNAIEEDFSKVKTTLKSLEDQEELINDIHTLVLTSFMSITPMDCEKWISHCQIYQ